MRICKTSLFTFSFFLLPLFIFGQQKKIDSLLAVVKTTSSDTHLVTLYNRIASEYNETNDSAALGYAKKAMDLATKTGFDKGLAMAYGSYANALGNRGKYYDEIGYHLKAAALWKKEGVAIPWAKELGNLAITEWTVGDYTPATDHCLQSIHIYDSIGNKFQEAVSRMTLGNIYFDEKVYPEALTCYRLAIKLNDASDKNEMVNAGLLLDIGNVYNRKKINDSALFYYNQSLDVLEKKGTARQKAIILNNMGTVLEDLGKHDEAMENYRKSFSLRVGIGDSDGVCSVYQNIGNLFADVKQFDSALYYYNAALGIAQRLKIRSQEASCYSDMYACYADMGKYKEAYEYQSKYLELNDSLIGAENVASVNELREKFDSEKRDRQIRDLEVNAKLDAEHSQRNIMLMLVVALATLLLASFFYFRYRSKTKINLTLEHQNAEITLQKKSIDDSINYAKRIQDSILPPEAQIKRVLPNSFILYQPKDVVSGDFYWLDSKDNYSVFAAVDCTGHGVPGALMSVVGFNLLNQAVNEMGLTKPSDIIHHLDYGVNKLLRQSDGGDSVKDGMDLALCSYDSATRKLQYAGVFNPAYIISKGEFIQLKPDKFPIGINADGVTDNYTNHEFQLYPGDMIYLFSDGYADQFGGPMGKKFKYTRFRDLLLSIYQLPCEEQKLRLKKDFVDWKGGLEQVDDILVIGVRVE
jgi:serine phosphatase RsbU (regulator of sigma subunit)/Tfp pilus assembly protein PilF